MKPRYEGLKEIGADVDECLDPSPAPAPHLYITNHLTSLTSFKTMFNIVYELASSRPLFVVGVGGGRGG